MTAAAQVLLLTSDENRRAAWREALAACCLTLPDQEAKGSQAPFDIVVTDATLPLPPPPATQEHSADVPIGIVAVGCGLAADVVLPAEATPRELQLACRLLAEIVGLRRERLTGRRRESALSHLALTDPLTGLANRRAWEDLLAAGEGPFAGAGPWCVAIFDIDHFKGLNDAFGHPLADRCLEQVASHLARAVRSGDFLARLGGDEFAAAFANLDADRANQVVERVRLAACLPAQADGPVVTLSAGWCCATSDPNAATIKTALEIADRRLRDAKAQGRNCTRGSVKGD